MNPELDKLLDTWFESHKGLSPSKRAIEELGQKIWDEAFEKGDESGYTNGYEAGRPDAVE